MGKMKSTFLITDINFVNDKLGYTLVDVNDGIEFRLTEIKPFTLNDIVSDWLKCILIDNLSMNPSIKYKNVKLPLKFDGVITGALMTVEDLKPIPNHELRIQTKIYDALLNIEKRI